MDVLSDSLSLLTREWYNILGILLIFFLGSGIVFLFLKNGFGAGFTFAEYFALSAGGGLIPLFLGILLAWFLNLSFGVKLNLIPFLAVVLIMAGIFTIYRSWRKHHRTKALSNLSIITNKTEAAISARDGIPIFYSLALILILVISIFLRLGFISKLIVPLYFDSATHYSIIQGLIADYEKSVLPTFSALMAGYYHLGFHVLAASLSQALNINAIGIILIIGQIILALIPLPLFFIIN